MMEPTMLRLSVLSIFRHQRKALALLSTITYPISSLITARSHLIYWLTFANIIQPMIRQLEEGSTQGILCMTELHRGTQMRCTLPPDVFSLTRRQCFNHSLDIISQSSFQGMILL